MRSYFLIKNKQSKDLSSSNKNRQKSDNISGKSSQSQSSIFKNIFMLFEFMISSLSFDGVFGLGFLIVLLFILMNLLKRLFAKPIKSKK
jgi:hypothetical protein